MTLKTAEVEHLELVSDFEANLQLGLSNTVPLNLLAAAMETKMREYDAELRNDKWQGILEKQSELTVQSVDVESYDVDMAGMTVQMSDLYDGPTMLLDDSDEERFEQTIAMIQDNMVGADSVAQFDSICLRLVEAQASLAIAPTTISIFDLVKELADYELPEPKADPP